MNLTEWHTLTDFVVYFGKSGKCYIDQTEKGWFIAWINQEELRKQKALHNVRSIHNDEERLQQLLWE
ncbi:unnamed protein product, partial [Onchocerca ochengi]|uniref:Kin17_mid domain-containing protein n=1 Tax=Onchocerca ochengi TaxID=42157 RepID=A0A182ESI8_ONCOC